MFNFLLVFPTFSSVKFDRENKKKNPIFKYWDGKIGYFMWYKLHISKGILSAFWGLPELFCLFFLHNIHDCAEGNSKIPHFPEWYIDSNFKWIDNLISCLKIQFSIPQHKKHSRMKIFCWELFNVSARIADYASRKMFRWKNIR